MEDFNNFSFKITDEFSNKINNNYNNKILDSINEEKTKLKINLMTLCPLNF